MTKFASAAEFFIYPLKSARAIACTAVRVMSTGFEWDRQWMFVDTRGTFLSQRTHPQLACVVPVLGRHGIRLTAPHLQSLEVPYTIGGDSLAVRVHGDNCVGIDQGSAASDWASEVVGVKTHLVRVPDDTERRANPAYAGVDHAPMGFADGFPVLVCNQASLEDLNTRLPQPIPMERFRPNIVLTGLEPWVEDQIDTIEIGDLLLRLVKPCTRCSIPSIDQKTGLPSTDPMPALKSFRFNRRLRGVMFGENAVIVRGVGEHVQPANCRIRFRSSTARAESP